MSSSRAAERRGVWLRVQRMLTTTRAGIRAGTVRSGGARQDEGRGGSGAGLPGFINQVVSGARVELAGYLNAEQRQRVWVDSFGDRHRPKFCSVDEAPARWNRRRYGPREVEHGGRLCS